MSLTVLQKTENAYWGRGWSKEQVLRLGGREEVMGLFRKGVSNSVSGGQAAGAESLQAPPTSNCWANFSREEGLLGEEIPLTIFLMIQGLLCPRNHLL